MNIRYSLMGTPAMYRTSVHSIVAVALLVPRLSFGDDQLGVEQEERRFALGIRFGLIPPVFTVLESTLRPASHLALNAYGIYLPDGPGGQGRRLTMGGNLTIEFGEPRRSGWYLSVGAGYYHAYRDASGNYEESLTLPLTGGYLVKSGHFEVQLGTGVQAVLSDKGSALAAPCTSWLCLRQWYLPVFPAVELVFRYAF